MAPQVHLWGEVIKLNTVLENKVNKTQDDDD